MGDVAKKLTFGMIILTIVLVGLLGLIAQVSFSVIFVRALTAAVTIGFLTYITCFVLYSLILKDHIIDTYQETNIDFIANDEISLDEISNEGKTKTESIKPFTPTQINPNIEKIINEDPEKAADILRKMGLDE